MEQEQNMELTKDQMIQELIALLNQNQQKKAANDVFEMVALIDGMADVFDAISQKRCYRDAMPLDKCFAIIEEGSGSDFEPELVEVFLSCKEEITKVCMEFRGEKTEGGIS